MNITNKETAQEFLDTLEKIDINFINNSEQNKRFGNLKWYMQTHPEDNDVKEILNSFAERYQKLFLNKNLKEAFDIQDNLYYYKRQQIYKYFPFNFNTSQFLTLLLFTTNALDQCGVLLETETIDNVIEFIKNNTNCYIDDNLINKIKAFLNNNPILFKPCMKPDKYNSYEYEFNEFNTVINNKKTKDYNDYFQLEINDQWKTEEKIKNNYLSKRIGNIGEMELFKYMNNLRKPEFVAKLSSGFGYDLYYQELINDFIQEVIVESKATYVKTPDSIDDNFKISKNEFKVMNESLSRGDYSTHLLIRTFINTKKREFEFLRLHYNINNNAFFDDNKKACYEYDYEENNGIIYKKIKTIY